MYMIVIHYDKQIAHIIDRHTQVCSYLIVVQAINSRIYAALCFDRFDNIILYSFVAFSATWLPLFSDDHSIRSTGIVLKQCA